MKPDAPGPNPTEPAPLRLLFWESTARCNLACLHCRRLETSPESNRHELTTGEAQAVFDSAARLGRPIIVFSGGEPLMRSDWEELSAHARNRGLPTALATNGTLIDSALAARIVAARFRRVSVSLDGADAPTHDAFRNLPGAMARAMNGIDHLRTLGQSVQINATIAAHNAHQLEALYELAVTLGADALHLFLLVPVGCGEQIDRTHRLTPRQYEGVLEWILGRMRQDGGLELRATCAPHLYRVAAQAGVPLPGRGCLAGRSVIFVGHRGEVFPCGYLPVSCGNIRNTPLEDIWKTSIVLSHLRTPDLLAGKCGQCEFKTVCGGCRARAHAATGSYLASEPACTHQPGNDPATKPE